MDRAALQQVRSFNRAVADGIGLVTDRFLGQARPHGESRLLWEIGPGGSEIRALRRRLALDSGYVSRVLQSLAAQGLVRISASSRDRRVRSVSLTARGRVQWRELDRRSDAVARRILLPLTDKQRDTLVNAMSQVERLVRASRIHFSAENPGSADARRCFDEYFKELDRRFAGGFDPALSISADVHELTPPAGVLVLARLNGAAIGCGALKFHRRQPSELKRMWIDPAARGLGVGARLLEELERQARNARVRAIRLETNGALSEAIALYRSAGYIEVKPFNDEPYAHHWFEKKLATRTPSSRRPGSAGRRRPSSTPP
jgi:DNA-binding MarR family transcriptional regulator/ribosomal protein S18 acetylase RimI-like enzyme